MKIINTRLKYKLDPTPRASTREGAPAYYSLKFEDAGQVQALFLNEGTLEAEYAKTLPAGSPIAVAKDNKGKYTFVMPDVPPVTPTMSSAIAQPSPEDLERAKQEAGKARSAAAKELCKLYAAIYHNLRQDDVAPEHLQGAASTVFIAATSTR